MNYPEIPDSWIRSLKKEMVKINFLLIKRGDKDCEFKKI